MRCFLVDAQLPRTLARRLNDLGVPALHVGDTALSEADDRAIWAYAEDRAYVILTKDADFADLANIRSKGPPIVWLRLGNISNEALWARLSDLLPAIVDRIESVARVIEVRR